MKRQGVLLFSLSPVSWKFYALSKKFMTFFMILPVRGSTNIESQHVFTTSRQQTC